MAKKCPKNFSLFFQQKTLAETWFSRKNSNTSHNVKDKKVETDFVDDQSASDNDFVASSQDTSEFKLRKKVNRTLLRKSPRLSISSHENVNQSLSCKSKSNTTPRKTPKSLVAKLETPNSKIPKINNSITSPNESDKKLIIGDLCEVSSFVIKEEIDEMLQTANDFDSIEMKHDLSDLVADDEMLVNGLGCSPTIITCQGNTQSMNERVIQEEQDPLYIDENDRHKEQDPLQHIDKRENSILKKSRKRKTRSETKNERENQQVKRNSIDIKNEDKSDESLRTLADLHIRLEHTVPPQHKIENCAGSRPLNANQILLFETYGPLKRGPFTKTEDEIIKRNWTNFCKLHDWKEELVEPFLNMRHEGKYYIASLEERKNFVRFLSNGLPWRSLYSVYFRFKNLYSNSINNSRYTRKEDLKIIKHITRTSQSGVNKKCAELAKMLNRKRHSIWQRYQKLKISYNLKSIKLEDSYESDFESEEEQKTKKKKKSSSYKIKTTNDDMSKQVYLEVNWSYPLVSRFIEKLLEIMSCDNIEELKNQAINDEIWKKMQKMISIDYLVLQHFWNLQLHMQLFCPKPIYLNDLKVDLIEYLYNNNISSDSIEWDKVKLDFEGLTSTFLSNIFNHLVKHVKAKLNTTDIKEIIEYLYNTHIPELEEKTTDAILPKLHYKNGRLILDKGSEIRPSKGTTTDPLCDEEYEN